MHKRVRVTNYERFYRRLFRPLERELGTIDPLTIVAILGFDVGGPLNFCTFGEGRERCVTYVSCELAVRSDQIPASFGRYELLATCNSEDWVRRILTKVGRMSLEERFDDGHTLDLASWVKKRDRIQGIVFVRECTSRIGGATFGVLRCVGITRGELDFALATTSAELVLRLREAGVYPRTEVARKAISLPRPRVR